jgi:lanosterol synthase
MSSNGLSAPEMISKKDIASAVRFILQEQNADGGFGSYEPRRTPFSIEWLNPAEMFGDSMTENSYVECTASCLAALAHARHYLDDPTVVSAPIARAMKKLRTLQYPNGAWPGVWGVRLIYGTLFGIRGLIAGGARPTDPQIRKACTWLKSHQRPDGSWGEAHVAEPSDVYREETEGQVTQTAWALSALIEAGDHDWDAAERAARFLASSQLGSGEWPRQKPAGVFFHTALLDYTLYRSYFPLWALGQYETRRQKRLGLYDQGTAEPTAAE